MSTYEQIQALNWSTLKHLDVSPKMLQWRSEHPREDTEALELGRAIHYAILEPERFPSVYAVPPKKWDRRFKEQKAEHAAWLGSLPPGVEILEPDEHALAERCAAAVHAHPGAARLLRSGRREEIVTWTDEATGLACKGRLDFIAPGYVLDLKSTRQQKLRGIERDVASYLYFGQLAYYHDGAIAARLIPPDARGPYSIAVQTVEPYDVVPIELHPEYLEEGRALYRELLEAYVACQAADWYPGLAPDVITLRPPSWLRRTQREEMDW